MKIEIMGFYQPRALELGLDVHDLAVMQWINEDSIIGNLTWAVIDGTRFYILDYACFELYMPCAAMAMGGRFDEVVAKLVACGVLLEAETPEFPGLKYHRLDGDVWESFLRSSNSQAGIDGY